MTIASLALAGIIGLAGALGALARYILGRFIAERAGSQFPLGTLFINVTGAFAIGLMFAFAGRKLINPAVQSMLATGFLGGYTTFSSLALGDMLLFGSSHWLAALLYLILSIVGGILAIILGDWLGQRCLSALRRPVPSSKVTRRLTGMLSGSLLQETTSHQHLDIQDDLLLPEMQNERKTRQKHSGR